MRLLDLTLRSPLENIALDEALLDSCAQDEIDETLRFWESPDYCVVLGVSNTMAESVNRDICERDHVPIVRRSSGGGAVLIGPGCLNYSLVLSIAKQPNLAFIDSTNQYILEKQKYAIKSYFDLDIESQGISDLAIKSRKISGAAQKRTRTHVLFHGTYLYNFKIVSIAKYIPNPIKQPEYRKNRDHEEFVKNLSVDPDELKSALKQCWNAFHPLDQIPLSRMRDIIDKKLGREEWIYRV